jgi:glycosyltransferase 2 family protein
MTAAAPEQTVTATGPERPRRRGLVGWVKIVFFAAAPPPGAWYLVKTWPDTRPALSRIGWGAALASLVPAVAAVVAAMIAWRRLLADLGAPLPVRPAARVYYTSQLGKYLPGSVWTFVAQVELARDLKVPRAVSGAASMLAVALSLAVGLGVAAVLLPFGAADAMRRFWWLWLVGPLLLAAVHPRVTRWGMDRMLRLLRRPPLAVQPTVRGALAAAGWSALSWVLMGLHCVILVRAAGAGGWRVVPLAVGGFALAYCAGVLFVPAPAGVGVRELALGAALSTAVTPQVATAVVLVSRLAFAAVDLGMAAATFHRRGPIRYPRRPEE